ncbi:MAG: cytochrome c biogenesis protein ResB, partial [Chloroflexota bacterium]|nr:cytochrome c biogenesis protein ResB [Chloroflexota bacterium]
MIQEGQSGLPAQPRAERPAMRSSGATGRLARDAWRRFWRLFSSVRTAVVLILVLTGLTLIGTLVIQVPPDVAASPSEFAWWKANVAAAKVGFWAKPVGLLGLFDTFHSIWFLGAGILLLVNILVCSLNRWAGIKDAVTGTKVRLADGFYDGGSNRAQFASAERSGQEAASVVAQTLKRRGYRVRQAVDSESVYIAADKNRLLRLGTYLSHLSIILLILGFLLGSYLGFRERAFMVPEGSVRELGRGTNLSLQLDSFVDEYYPEGPPKDYRSEVVLYENGQEVKRGLIRVNHLLGYKGVRFYQSFYG